MANRVINTILNLKDNFSKTLGKVSQNTKTFEKQMKQAELQGKKLRSSISSSFSGITKAVGVAGVAGMGAFAVTSAKTFATFEQSMSNVEGLLGKNATPQIMSDLGNLAEEMGRKTSKSASECADALGYMALAGWDNSMMMKNLEPILRMSEGAGLDLARTSDLVTDSYSALGLTADELSGYMDIVAKTQASANTSAEGMMEAYISVGGMFKNLNVPLEESASMLGILANRGIKSSEAGNSLNSILINLTSGAGQAGDAMASLGVSAYDSVTGKFKGIEQVLKEVQNATKDFTDEQRDSVYAMIAGKTQMTAFNALLSGVNEEYTDLKTNVGDCTGALNDLAKTKQDNLIGRLTQIKSGIEGIQIRLIKQFKPQLTGFLDMILDKLPAISDYLANKVEWFVGVLPKLISLIKFCSPAIMGVVSALAGFMIITKVLAMISAFKKVMAGFSLMATLTNPIVLIAVGIGLVVAAMVYFYKTSETFRESINGLLVKFQEFGEWLGVVLPPIFQVICDWFNTNIIPIFQKFGAVALEVWTTKIYPAISSIAQNLQILWDNVLAPLGAFLIGVFAAQWLSSFETMLNISSSVGQGIMEVIGSFSNILSNLLDFIINVFTGQWGDAWTNVITIFSNLFEGIKDIVKTVLNVVIDTINGVIGGINKMTSIEIAGKSIGITIPKIPKFATGTQYFSGGLAEINEHGGEMAVLPSGSKVIPSDKTDKLLDNSGSSPVVNITIQGNVIGNHEFVNEMGAIITRKLKLALMQG